MIRAVNAPIHLFIKYVNKFFPSEEDVVIFVVDNELEINSEIPLIGETADGDLYLGRYWRQEQPPHIILVRQELKVHDTLGVLAHEYVHHLIWEDSMLEMTDAEIHELPKFGDLWEKVSDGCIQYVEERCVLLGFEME
jgi:hypothetical protein